MVHQKILILSVLVAILFSCVVPAGAHPHIFIVQRLDLVFDGKGLAGIKVRWKFDDMFAGMIAEDHDRNHNGRLEHDEVQSIRENAFSYLAEHNYFIFITIGNKPFKVGYTTDFTAILQTGNLSQGPARAD